MGNIRAMDPINESGAGEKEAQLAVECARDGSLAMSPSGESRAAGLISLIPLDSVEVAREQYDTQADEYKQSKLAPWRQYVEKHTADSLISLIGGVEGKNVIDLACGDGHYSRWLKGEKKAAGVLGVDLSEAMVNLANEEEVPSMLCLVSVFACDWPFLLRVPPYIQLILSDAIALTAYTSLLIVRACQAREPLGIQYTCCD